MQELESKVRKLWDSKKELTNTIIESYAINDGTANLNDKLDEIFEDLVVVNETLDAGLIDLERFLDEKGFYN